MPETETTTASGNGASPAPSTERPELAVGAALLGGFVLAQVLKHLGKDG